MGSADFCCYRFDLNASVEFISKRNDNRGNSGSLRKSIDINEGLMRGNHSSPDCGGPVWGLPRMGVVSATGFEPMAPGFIPLRLSPPPGFVPLQGPGVRGLDCPFAVSLFRLVGTARPVSTPSGSSVAERGLARDRHGQRWPERSPNLSGYTMGFPVMAPNYLRNPVLYPAELRGHTLLSILKASRRSKGAGFSAELPVPHGRPAPPRSVCTAGYPARRSVCRRVPAPVFPARLG